MKNWLWAISVSALALSAGYAIAQNVGVEVTAPADADVTITEQQMQVPVNNGGYNNTDMQPLPDNPGVEVESVQDAMTPQMQTETDVNIQETVPAAPAQDMQNQDIPMPSATAQPLNDDVDESTVIENNEVIIP